MRRLIAPLALLLLATAGCGQGDASNAAIRGDGSVDLTKVTLRVGDQKAGAQVLLEAAGQLTGLKYKITWSQFPSGPPLLEAANAGAVDVGSVGNTPPVFAAAAGSKIAIVAGTDQRLEGQAVLVPKGSAIRTPADLKGKRVAVAKGSSANYHLLTVLKKAGLGFGDIQVSYLQPADALAAFTSGRVDAWTIWDPYTAQAQAQTGARVLVDGNGYVNGYSFQVAGRTALGNKATAAALRDYLARLQKATLWANTHQKQWATVWSQQTGLPIEVTTTAVQRRVSQPIRIDDAVVTAEQQLADAFTEAKLLPGQVKIADFVDRRFNDIVGASQ